jgi:transcriptional antiterminator NusG
MFSFRHVYCLFCKTGKEEIVKCLCEKILGIEAIFLTAEQFRFYRGQHKKMVLRVLPSYLFLFFNGDIDIGRITQIEHVFRVLTLTGDHQLHENDLKFARWVYESGGVVKTSQAYRQGDHIVIVDGPLKDYEGDIVWVDKRKGKAKVHIVTESLDTYIWLFFEYIEAGDSGDPEHGVRNAGLGIQG